MSQPFIGRPSRSCVSTTTLLTRLLVIVSLRRTSARGVTPRG
jgi:hypothetical protein